MTRAELMPALCAWLETTRGAGEAADWLLDRAEATGEIPKQPSLDVSTPWQDALASFFSARFVRLSNHARKLTVYFNDWELDQFGECGVFLTILAEIRGRPLVNRKQQRQERQIRIGELLQPHAGAEGLSGHVARSELGKLDLCQGRFWSRSIRWSVSESEREVARYFKLLTYADGLHADAGRIERLVHVSRVVAGDTHWLRPRNQIWRDLAEDVLDFDAELKARLDGVDGREAFSRALAEFGIVENLTSVMVMVFGHFALQRGTTLWNWPKEATQERLPIWFSAIHLKGSRVVSEVPVTQVITVENETSFLDLTERYGHDASVVLVYTEGQANRAVVQILRLLSDGAPAAQFKHQGDLDVPGVRILRSLCVRSGLPIKPEYMDAETHQRFAKPGIQLSDAEYEDVKRELALARLPCRDLLEQIAVTRTRVEQESITGGF